MFNFLNVETQVILFIAVLFVFVRFLQISRERKYAVRASNTFLLGTVGTPSLTRTTLEKSVRDKAFGDTIFTKLQRAIESRMAFDFKKRLVVIERERSACNRDTMYVYINDGTSAFLGSPIARGYPIVRLSIHLLSNDSFITLTHSTHRYSDVYLTDSRSVERLIETVIESIEERTLLFVC